MLEDMIERMRKKEGHWPRICKEADVPYQWLKNVMSGRTPNPGIDRVERVLRVLEEEEG